MNGKDSKVKGFIKKHSAKIIGGTILIGAYVVGECMYRIGYVDGANDGIRAGFGRTIQWCDRKFDDVQLTDKVNTWAQENPEKWYGPLLRKEEA